MTGVTDQHYRDWLEGIRQEMGAMETCYNCGSQWVHASERSDELIAMLDWDTRKYALTCENNHTLYGWGGRPGSRGTDSQASTSGQTQTGIPPTVVNGEGKSE